jgi:hypothetical protein
MQQVNLLIHLVKSLSVLHEVIVINNFKKQVIIFVPMMNGNKSVSDVELLLVKNLVAVAGIAGLNLWLK